MPDAVDKVKIGRILQAFRDGSLTGEEARKQLGTLLGKNPDLLVLTTDGETVDLGELRTPNRHDN